MKIIKLATMIFAMGTVACSSNIKKAQIDPAADPSAEIQRLEQAQQAAYNEQVDVLDEKNFDKSLSYLKEAKSDLASGEKQSEVLENVAYGDAYLAKSLERARSRQAQIPAILEARQKAITAGARNYGPTSERLKELDDDLRDEAGEFNKIRANEMAEIQQKYLDLELRSITAQQLGQAAQQIVSAKERKAARYSPKALKQAEMDFLTAENKIGANRNAADTYAEEVARANQSAEILTATLAATRSGKVDEATAAQLVAKDRQIASLSGNLSEADSRATELQTKVDAQGRRLDTAGRVLSLQESLESARQQFSNDEAEVYQQGDKLLIRLKAMNFASGRSDLPASALPILAKVRGVAEELGSESIVVEGHTDSTGQKALNKALSEKRADSVAKYFETNGLEDAKLKAVGYGFQKPIASNKTKTGRQQNRRVDVIITPKGLSDDQTAQ